MAEDIENTPGGDEATTTEFNMNDAMSRAYEDIEDRESGEENTGGDRLRDESGRFASQKPEGQAPDQAAAPDGDADPTAINADPAQQEPGTPQGWKPQEVEVFRNLPEEVQGVILRRQQELQGMVTRKAQEVGELGRFGQALHDNVFGSRIHQMVQQGINPVQRTAELFGYADAMQSDPAGTIGRLIKETGLSVRQLAESAGLVVLGEEGSSPRGVQPDQKQPIDDPRITQLMQTVQQLAAGNQQQQVQSLTAEVGSFADATGEDGALVRPFFNDVFETMLDKMADVQLYEPHLHPQVKLQKAYDLAVSARPDVRQRAEQARQAQEAMQRNTRARQANKGGRNVRQTGVAPAGKRPTAGAGDMRSTMEQVFDDLNG
jgi:hypothetical protein